MIVLILALTLGACSKDPDPSTGDTGNPNNTTDAANSSDTGGGRDSGNGGGDVNSVPDMTAPTDMSTAPDTGTDVNTPVDLGPSPDPVATAGATELVQEGFQFTEGPRWYPAEAVLRFTDIPANTIFELTEPDTIVAFTTASQGANGLAFDSAGKVLAAEHGGRRISMYDGTTATALVDSYQGNAFNSPNDLVVRQDGVIYFTDPPYGLTGAREINFNGLFRYDPSDGAVIAEWEGNQNQTRPNGVVLSPDESLLYLADTMASRVYLFDVAADGALSGEREFVTVSGPDGMAMDVFGNLYVTTNGGIEVFAPDGASYGVIPVGRRPANCAFGGADGRTLYVTAREGLYRIPLAVTGIY